MINWEKKIFKRRKSLLYSLSCPLTLGYIPADSLPLHLEKKKKKGMIFLTFSKPTPSLTQKNGKKGQIHKKKKKKAQRSGVESNDKRRE
jgi:hypothetical protein